MNTDVVLRTSGLVKRFGALTAVADLDLEVRRGEVVGLLGPNGAGKSTTIGMVLGLVAPTAGTAQVQGHDVVTDRRRALASVGAMLEVTSFYPYLSGRDNLAAVAMLHGDAAAKRVDPLLERLGLTARAESKFRTYSLGMRQRLALASALLGDPEVLVLDEPANGLDPQGIRWLRDFIRSLGGEGRTVFVSSHVLAEIAQTVDSVVIINRGRLVTHASLAEVAARTSGGVRVRSPEASRLREALAARGIESTPVDGHSFVARETTTEQVGEAAAHAAVVLHELVGENSSLEEVFLQLTGEAPVTSAEPGA